MKENNRIEEIFLNKNKLSDFSENEIFELTSIFESELKNNFKDFNDLIEFTKKHEFINVDINPINGEKLKFIFINNDTLENVHIDNVQKKSLISKLLVIDNDLFEEKNNIKKRNKLNKI